jgi:hypothetical protein
VPDGGLVSRLLAFNVGVEVGQFTAPGPCRQKACGLGNGEGQG